MPAPENNRYAARGDTNATAILHLRCTPADKSAWVRAAQERAAREQLPASEAKLSAWATAALNAAAQAQPGAATARLAP